MEYADVSLALELGCNVPQVRLYRRNAAALRELHDLWAMEPGTMAKLASGGLLDLVVERLWEREASLSHYGIQNGDLMADPDIVLQIDPKGAWIRAVEFRNDYLGMRRDYRDDPRGCADLNRFLATWLVNMKSQGYVLRLAGEGA